MIWVGLLSSLGQLVDILLSDHRRYENCSCYLHKEKKARCATFSFSVYRLLVMCVPELRAAHCKTQQSSVYRSELFSHISAAQRDARALRVGTLSRVALSHM